MGILFSGYQFSKRVNSTKIVDTGAIISGNVVFKENTSFNEPIFIMAVGAGDMSAAFKVNYAKCFDNYYFVTDIEIINNAHIAFHCEIDAMANLKTEILATEAYCMYDTIGNSEIPDQRLSRNTSQSVSVSTASFPYNEGYTFIVGIVGKGGMSYFKMNPITMGLMLDEVSNWVDNAFKQLGELPNWDIQLTLENLSELPGAIAETVDWYIKLWALIIKNAISVGNALNNVRSGIYFPFSYKGTVGSRQVNLGAYETKVWSDVLNPDGYSTRGGCNVDIPWQASDWRRRSPYTEVYLYIPLIGLMHYPADSLVGQGTIHVDICINWTSGAMTCEVNAGSEVLGVYSTNVASNFAIGSSNVNPTQVAGAIAGVAGSAQYGSVGLINAAINLGNAVQPIPTVIGSNSGGAVPEDLSVYCYTVYHGTTVEPSSISSVCGTPSCCKRSLGSLSGYVQTVGVSVKSNAHKDEVDKVNSILDGGAFIE